MSSVFDIGAPREVGPYRLLRLLGQGASARTWLAEAPDGSRLAVKELQLLKTRDAKHIELFEREVATLRTLQHPQIPRFIETRVARREETLSLYLVQEFIEGSSLQQLLDGGTRFSPAETVAILRSCLIPLEYLHSRRPPIYHRDIKPSNVIRRPSGECVLIDFGSVREAVGDYEGGSVVGTFGYMAPEQFQARAYPGTDLYALGATAVHLISGVEPARFEVRRLKPDIHPWMQNVDVHLEAILDLLLEPAVEDRYSSARSLLKALDRWERTIQSSPRTSMLSGLFRVSNDATTRAAQTPRGTPVVGVPEPIAPTRSTETPTHRGSDVSRRIAEQDAAAPRTTASSVSGVWTPDRQSGVSQLRSFVSQPAIRIDADGSSSFFASPPASEPASLTHAAPGISLAALVAATAEPGADDAPAERSFFDAQPNVTAGSFFRATGPLVPPEALPIATLPTDTERGTFDAEVSRARDLWGLDSSRHATLDVRAIQPGAVDTKRPRSGNREDPNSTLESAPTQLLEQLRNGELDPDAQRAERRTGTGAPPQPVLPVRAPEDLTPVAVLPRDLNPPRPGGPASWPMPHRRARDEDRTTPGQPGDSSVPAPRIAGAGTDPSTRSNWSQAEDILAALPRTGRHAAIQADVTRPGLSADPEVGPGRVSAPRPTAPTLPGTREESTLRRPSTMPNPRLAILDEPTTTHDVDSAHGGHDAGAGALDDPGTTGPLRMPSADPGTTGPLRMPSADPPPPAAASTPSPTPAAPRQQELAFAPTGPLPPVRGPATSDTGTRPLVAREPDEAPRSGDARVEAPAPAPPVEATAPPLEAPATAPPVEATATAPPVEATAMSSLAAPTMPIEAIPVATDAGPDDHAATAPADPEQPPTATATAPANPPDPPAREPDGPRGVVIDAEYRAEAARAPGPAPTRRIEAVRARSTVAVEQLRAPVWELLLPGGLGAQSLAPVPMAIGIITLLALFLFPPRYNAQVWMIGGAIAVCWGILLAVIPRRRLGHTRHELRNGVIAPASVQRLVRRRALTGTVEWHVEYEFLASDGLHYSETFRLPSPAIAREIVDAPDRVFAMHEADQPETSVVVLRS